MPTIAFVIDPITSLKAVKDSTVMMVEACLALGWKVGLMEAKHISVSGQVTCVVQWVQYANHTQNPWYDVSQPTQVKASDLDVVMMRKDPPFDMDYVIATYLLEKIEQSGVLVLNKPKAIRDCNEKLFILNFPDCIAPTVVSAQQEVLKSFLAEHQDVIIKPLNEMGGSSVFRLSPNDPNINVVIESLTHRGVHAVMMQAFITDIAATGDKRILMIDGEPMPYPVSRRAKPGETRSNLAAGGSAHKAEFTERDAWLCQKVGPQLKERGLLFVGLDVIGNFITEINVTSPTCAREVEELYGVNIMPQLFDCIAAKLC